jgi:hypothetical protein
MAPRQETHGFQAGTPGFGRFVAEKKRGAGFRMCYIANPPRHFCGLKNFNIFVFLIFIP